jgi:hypothetical protein
MDSLWIKNEIFDRLIFPQYPYFCGIASCCTVSNTILNLNYTQEDLHHKYGVGTLTKLNIPKNDILVDITKYTKSNISLGFSNWDIIRLFNSLMLDNKIIPYSALLTGKVFVDVVNKLDINLFNNWLKLKNNNIIIHLENHFVIYAGYYRTSSNSSYIICADSSKKKGPLNTINYSDLILLCNSENEKYGFILLSDAKISLIDTLHESKNNMLPIESIDRHRFVYK